MLQSSREDGYDYVTTLLPSNLEARTDVTALDSRWWRTSVVGIVHENPTLHTDLPRQMEWAHHMNIPAVILPAIPTKFADAADYARLVSSVALTASTTNGQVWIKVALTDDALVAFEKLHRQCDGASNVGMLLLLDNSHSVAANPTAAVAAMVARVHKAAGLNLKAVSFPTPIFLTNKRGYPALSKTHQVLFTEILRRLGRTIRVLVEGPPAHAIQGNAAGATHCLPYLQYIRHMRQRPEVIALLDSEEASLEEAYLDHLQRPLQPLGDHLEFSTYETFEKDPVKYQKYQDAISLALRDNLTGAHNKLVNIVVAGAGRGPLVTAAINSIKAMQNVPPTITFRVFAVEKNPSAIVYLRSLVRHEPSWKGLVTVAHSDMRSLSRASLGGNQADILVSELLGSFGDNELSPECLDSLYGTGVVKENTVCIPTHYTSYAAPVSSLRLHSEARAQAYFPNSSSDGLDSAPMGTLKVMETPYVVRSHAASQTHVEQACWEFSHPSTASSRERKAHVVFKPDVTQGAGCGAGYGIADQAIASMAQASGKTESSSIMIHGFLGTFNAILYASNRDDSTVALSTRPADFSTGMFSWFPLYFPLKEPLLVPAGADVAFSIWRKVEKDKVWYEWGAQAFDKYKSYGCTPIHNPNGRSYQVRL
jgi:protein arginine N-methyltransferase 5